jgi:hypothetical protein
MACFDCCWQIRGTSMGVARTSAECCRSATCTSVTPGTALHSAKTCRPVSTAAHTLWDTRYCSPWMQSWDTFTCATHTLCPTLQQASKGTQVPICFQETIALPLQLLMPRIEHGIYCAACMAPAEHSWPACRKQLSAGPKPELHLLTSALPRLHKCMLSTSCPSPTAAKVAKGTCMHQRVSASARHNRYSCWGVSRTHQRAGGYAVHRHRCWTCYHLCIGHRLILEPWPA